MIAQTIMRGVSGFVLIVVAFVLLLLIWAFSDNADTWDDGGEIW